MDDGREKLIEENKHIYQFLSATAGAIVSNVRIEATGAYKEKSRHIGSQEKQDWDTALQKYQNALSIYDSAADLQGQISVNSAIGYVKYLKGDRIPALKHLQQAVNLSSGLETRFRKLCASTSKATFVLWMNRHFEASRRLRQL